MNALRHIPAIDGVRAIAILGVLAFHAFPGLCPGGFAGVDIFFVLSGYLITANLRRAIEAGEMSLLDFYVRRARRILPALVVLLIVVTGLALVIMMPADLDRYGTSLLGAAASCANILFYRSLNYFEPASNLLPLLHTWSLAVEEQFYLLFPLLLMGVHRCARRALPEVILLLLLVSLATSVLETPRAPAGAFFLLPSRAWELLGGALLAWGRIPPLGARGLREALAAVGAAMMVAAYGLVDIGQPWPGYWALLPCVGAMLTIQAVASGPTATGRILSWPPVVGIGLISYSLYLWHWPLLSFNDYLTSGMPPSDLRVLACVLLAFPLAWASWRWVEQPFRTRTSRFAGWSRPRLLLISGAALAGLMLLGLGLHWSGGLPRRLPATVLAIDAFSKDHDPENPGHFIPSNADFTWESLPRLGAAVPPTIAMIGDSHGEALFSALGDMAAQHQRSIVAFLQKGVPPLYGIEMTAFPNRVQLRRKLEAVFSRVTAEPGITKVILAARWAVYVHGLGLDGRVHFGNRPPHLRDGAGSTSEDDLALLKQGLEAGIAKLRAGGKQVVVVGPVPELGFLAPMVLAQAVRYGRDPMQVGITRAFYQQRQQGILDLLEHLPAGVTLMSPDEMLWDGARYKTYDAGMVWYFDDNHLSLSGARRLAPLFRALFE